MRNDTVTEAKVVQLRWTWEAEGPARETLSLPGRTIRDLPLVLDSLKLRGSSRTLVSRTALICTFLWVR